MKFELNQMMCLSSRTIRKMSTVGVNQEPINQKYKINNKKKRKKEMPGTIMMARESWRWQMLTLVRSHIGCSVTWNILVARKKKCFLLKDLAQMKPLLTRKSASSFKCTVRRQWTSQRFHAATNQKRRSIGPSIFRISSWGIFRWLRKTLNWKIVKFPPQRRPVGGWVFSFVRIYGLWSRSFAFKSDTGCSWCWFFCFELPSAFLLKWLKWGEMLFI